MTAVFLAARAAGALGTLPPVLILEKLAGRRRRRRHPEAVQRWAIAAHLAYGAGAGAAFALLLRRLPRTAPQRGAIAGTAWGVAVWLGSYEGWLPLVGILPPAHRDVRSRSRAIGIAHVVWGATLGALLRRGI